MTALCANDRWLHPLHPLGPDPHGAYCSSGCVAMGGPHHPERLRTTRSASR